MVHYENDSLVPKQITYNILNPLHIDTFTLNNINYICDHGNPSNFGADDVDCC
jgi:hypothetical protein